MCLSETGKAPDEKNRLTTVNHRCENILLLGVCVAVRGTGNTAQLRGKNRFSAYFMGFAFAICQDYCLFVF